MCLKKLKKLLTNYLVINIMLVTNVKLLFLRKMLLTKI